MPEIKAIETRYRGYRFRSRLEARYAVAFDMMKLEWQYELEGYDLGDVGYYLPDFVLPNFHQKTRTSCQPFAEVKPDRFTEKELGRVVALCEGTNRPVALLCGVPESRGYPFIKGRADDGGLDIAGWLYIQPNAANAARSARFEYGESG